MVRPSRPAPLMLEEPFMLFSGSLSGGLSSSSHSSSSSSHGHAHSHSIDHDDPSTTQDPCTILSPCSLPSSSTKDLSSSSSATGGLAPPLGASPRHGLDATNGGLPSVRGAAVVIPTQRSSISSSSTTTRKARNLTLGVVVAEQEAVLRQQTGAQQQQQHQQQRGDNDSNSNSTSPRLPPSGRTPTFAFFKRSNSASVSLVGMNNGGSHPSTPSPSSSHSASGLKIKKKRGFPHLILTPKGNSSHPFSMLPPRALPSLSSVANSNNSSSNNNNNNNNSSSSSSSSSSSTNKQVSSPASLINLMARLRRRTTIPLDDRSSCPPSLPPSSSSSSSTATTTSDTSNSNNRNLMIETGPRSASATGPMALSTMDFQYDGSKMLDYLYVGGEHIPSQDALAETFNITHIVNTTMKDYYPHHPFGQGDYCQLYLLDALSEELTSEKLEAAFQMVERARAGGHACLVHCRNGMSRSTSVVIAYLMRYYKMPLLEAFNFVRERRPCTSPNPSFMRQLARLERKWNGGGGNSLDVEHYADDRFASIRELAVKDEDEEEEEGREGGKVMVLEEVEEEEHEGGFEEEEEEGEEEGSDVGCPLSSGDECSARGSVGEKEEEEEEVEGEGGGEEGRGGRGPE